MGRTLKLAVRAAIVAPDGGPAVLWTATITHTSLAEPIYIVNDWAAFTAGGQTYQPIPFSAAMPADEADGPEGITLALDSINPAIRNAIAALNPDRPTVSLALWFDTDTDDPVAGPFALELARFTDDGVQLTADLETTDNGMEPCPGHVASPQNVPGLFGQRTEWPDLGLFLAKSRPAATILPGPWPKPSTPPPTKRRHRL